MDYVLVIPVLVTSAALVYYFLHGVITSEWLPPVGLWVGVVLLVPIAFFSRGCEYVGVPPPGDIDSMQQWGSEIDSRLRSMAEDLFPGLTVTGGAEWFVEEVGAKITDFVRGSGTWEIRGIDGFGSPEENSAAILRWWESNSPGFYRDPGLGTSNDLVVSAWFLEEGVVLRGSLPGDLDGWIRFTVWKPQDRVVVTWSSSAARRPWWLIPFLVSPLVMLAAAIALTRAARRDRPKPP